MCDTATNGPVAQLEIAALIAAAAGPGTDVEAIAGRLTDLATRLSAQGLTAVAVDAEQAAVDVLRAAGAPRSAVDAHLVLLARRIHNRAARRRRSSRGARRSPPTATSPSPAWTSTTSPWPASAATSSGCSRRAACRWAEPRPRPQGADRRQP